jgi:hypothetical protein
MISPVLWQAKFWQIEKGKGDIEFMQTQSQQEPDNQTQKRSFPRKRLIIACILCVFIIICAVFLILSIEHVIGEIWFYIISVILLAVGTLVAALQWIFPFSAVELHPKKTSQFSLQTRQEQAVDPIPTAPNTQEPFLTSFNSATNNGLAFPNSISPPLITTTPSIVESREIFFFNVKLPRASELYGRVSETRTLVDRARKGASTSIVGQRRIGKTWLLEYLMLVSKIQLGTRFRVGYIDATAPGCATLEGFTTRVAKTLQVSLSVERAKMGLVAIEEIVENLVAKRQPPILCIDEFEGLANKQEFDLEFFSHLRGLAGLGLALVVASKSPLIDIIGDYGKSSGFFNIFEQCMLDAFSEEEAETFINAKSLQADFNDLERDMMMGYGQTSKGEWPPLRLQLVGQMLLEDKLAKRKKNTAYLQRFQQRLEEKYRGVVR